jgi:hypothetical protein
VAQLAKGRKPQHFTAVAAAAAAAAASLVLLVG